MAMIRQWHPTAASPPVVPGAKQLSLRHSALHQARAALCVNPFFVGRQRVATSASPEPLLRSACELSTAAPQQQQPAAAASGCSSPLTGHQGKPPSPPGSPQQRCSVVAAAAVLSAPPSPQPQPLSPSPGAHHHNHELQHRIAAQPLLQRHVAMGQVDLILGPMFAGKTTALIRLAREAEQQGQRVLVLKSDKDRRYDTHTLATHDGNRLPCLAVARLAHVPDASLEFADVVAIDEAQFFPDLVPFVQRAADGMRKRVLVAGLDGDFRRQRFGHMLDLVPLADSVLKLHTHCHREGCTQPAIFSMRISLDMEQEVVGGKEKYLPVCRLHYAMLPEPPAAAAAVAGVPEQLREQN